MPERDPILARAELLAQVEAGWREFRGLIRHVGWAGMKGRTPAGWTYKDLLAHVAAWEEEAARSLRALTAGAAPPSYDDDAAVDAFNARAIEERRLVGPEAILDELASAHRALVALVRSMPDEVLGDARSQRWIANNTFAHYAEHRAELASSAAR